MEMQNISTISRSQNILSNEAVVVKDGYKKYGKTNMVLKGLTMTVHKGAIYGLLGPSGCGKTTLLHCILGVNKLDSGEIKVKARTKADIGFMPQEISLYNELSIMETMTFYGRIFNLSDLEIEKRTYELLSFLELPAKTRTIAGLSGGQSRRVSFAVALLHDPQLLILDEPTVGVDPVLCVSIWDKLVYMAQNENKTVIITTHYIEETRRAHTIGLMRNGKLLAEDSPSHLMTQHNVSNLEDVFLKLCQRQYTTSDGQRQEDSYVPVCPTSHSISQVPSNQMISCSKKKIFALLTKNFYWIKRNELIMAFLIVVTILDTVLYSECIGNDPKDLKLAVVDEEYPKISHCNWLYTNGCNFTLPLSCRYLNKLQEKTYDLIEYYDMKTAKKAVKENKVWGVIYFPKNYTAVMNERIMLKEKADNFSLMLSEVEIWLDMSNQYIGNQIRRDAIKGCVEYLQDLFFHCGWSPRMTDLPIKMEDAVYGSNNPKFRYSITASFLALFHFHLPMIFTTGSCTMEKMTGTLERSLISGVTILEIAVSLMIVQFVVLFFQSALMIIILYVLYDNPMIYGNLIWVVFLLFTAGTNGACYGFLVATLSTTDTVAIFMNIGTTFALFLLCGVVWPIDGMQSALRSFSNLLPVTRSADALRALTIKDWPLNNPAVYQGYIANIVWSCVYILITSMIIRKNKGLISK